MEPPVSDQALPESLTVPPFPPFAWDHFFWSGKDRFPEWDRFQDRGGAYGSPGPGGPAARLTSVSVRPANVNHRSAPTAEQAAAYAHLKAHGPAIRRALLAALLAEYPGWRAQYGYGDEAEELMPVIDDPAGFARLIGLGTVHVLSVAKDGVAYVGLELGCTWDGEHGLGAMTHRGRIVKLGGADTSFLEWIAEDDGGTSL
jgi:hypothetical protein